MKKRKVQVVDHEFEAHVEEFVSALSLEKKLDDEADTIRGNVREVLYEFQVKYRRGYETICQWLEAHGIKPPKLHIDDTLLGLTPEELNNLYKAAYQFVQDKEFAKGRDAFYFLVTLAPDTFDFWLGLAISCTHLKEYEAALDASLKAIEIDPTKSAGYKNAIHLYVRADSIDKALELCKQGSTLASRNRKEPWSQELHSVLEEAQSYIITTNQS